MFVRLSHRRGGCKEYTVKQGRTEAHELTARAQYHYHMAFLQTGVLVGPNAMHPHSGLRSSR